MTERRPLRKSEERTQAKRCRVLVVDAGAVAGVAPNVEPMKMPR
jgi:hypothetical protein